MVPNEPQNYLANLGSDLQKIQTFDIPSEVPTVVDIINKALSAGFAGAADAGESPNDLPEEYRIPYQLYSAMKKDIGEGGLIERWLGVLSQYNRGITSTLSDSERLELVIKYSPRVFDEQHTREEVLSLPPHELVPELFQGLVRILEQEEIDSWIAKACGVIDGPGSEQRWNDANEKERKEMGEEFWKNLQNSLVQKFEAMQRNGFVQAEEMKAKLPKYAKQIFNMGRFQLFDSKIG